MQHVACKMVTTFKQHVVCNILKMVDAEILAGACGVVIAVCLKKRHRKRRNRTEWTRDWIKKRKQFGAYHQLLQELQSSDITSYHHFLRMDVTTFEELQNDSTFYHLSRY